MKKLFAILSLVALSGSIYAGCGVKVPVSGELSAYDAEKKTLKVGSEEITLAAKKAGKKLVFRVSKAAKQTIGL